LGYFQVELEVRGKVTYSSRLNSYVEQSVFFPPPGVLALQNTTLQFLSCAMLYVMLLCQFAGIGTVDLGNVASSASMHCNALCTLEAPAVMLTFRMALPFTRDLQ
jgi:hypothetical protein